MMVLPRPHTEEEEEEEEEEQEFGQQPRHAMSQSCLAASHDVVENRGERGIRATLSHAIRR